VAREDGRVPAAALAKIGYYRSSKNVLAGDGLDETHIRSALRLHLNIM